MGNKLARTTQGSASEYYLHDLPSTCNLVLKEPLGGGRFLKSILCLHDEGLVVVKVYFKRGEFPDLKEHERKLQHIREQLSKVEQSHVWPFQYWLETDKAAYLLRQYFFSNLHDRISTRPFLRAIEKKWIAFQLLLSVKQSHERGICHGDIKCENVLVTSWNWLYLADYASFKPTFLPVDNPADFSFFFDTGGRRRCYVAPERFFEPGGDTGNVQSGVLTPAMDIFSVGCVIAELFMEGQALFDLSQLLAYRRGQYDPCPSLQKVVDVGVREMILHMIQLDPTARLTAEQYLQSWAPCVFPAYFSPLLHSFFSCLLPLDIDTRVAITQSAFPELCKQMIESSSPDYKDEDIRRVDQVQDDMEEEVGSAEAKQSWHTANIDATPMRRLKAAAVLMEKALMKQETEAVITDAIHQKDIYQPGQVLESKKHCSQGDLGHGGKCEGMVLIGSLLCASIRNVKLPQARRGAVQMLYKSCLYIDDESRLQQVLPYVVALLSDPAAIVRCAALQVVCHLLSLVKNFPPSDSKIFPEYILPLLSMLPDDPEESVRICYADNIHELAHTAQRFLESSHYMTEIGVLYKSVQSVKGTTKKMAAPSFPNQNGSRYMLELSQLRETIARVIQELVMGQKQTPNIRRALLRHVGHLCDFFGTRQCNDVLLPILPAFLNDRDEQLRAVFFEQIVYVCLFVGQTSIESYLLPYIEQALSDVEETVIVNALECLAAICVHRLLRKRVLLRAVERCAPLLCHPSQWVRKSALTVVASAGANLELVDSHAFLLPILSPFVRREPVSLNLESALSACLKTPMSREMFNRVLSDAMLSQTAPQKLENKKPERSKQKGGSPTTPLDTSSAKKFVEQQKADTEAHDLGNTSLLSPMRQGDRLPFTEMDDNEKMKAMEGYIRNLSSTMQSRMHNWEVDNSEKLQSSVIGANAGVGAGFYTNYDGSSDGIPLYSVPLSERRADSQRSSSFNEDWNGIIAVRHGTHPFHIAALSGTPSILPTVTTSHWAEGASTGHESHRQQAVLGSRFVSGSSFINAIGTRQAYEVIKDVDGGDTDTDFAKALTASRLKDNIFAEVSVQGALELPGTGVLQLTETDNLQPSSPSFANNQWQPRGVLIAHLQEHHRAVNKVSVSHDNYFFVSASDDGNIKFWDCRRLESNISFRSRLTYSFQGAKALGVCMIGNSPQVAAASSTGKIHVLRVDYVARVAGSIERYSGLTDVRNLETQEGAVVSLLNYSPDGPPMLLYTTQRNGIHLWDLRLQKDAWCLRAKPSQGYISATALASCYNWLVSGTSRGVLTLWDLRFQLPVNTWCHPSSSLVESTSTVFPPSESGAVATSRAYVYVAAGRDEVALWNAADGSCQQVLRLSGDPTDTEFADLPAALPRRRPSEVKRIEGSKKSDYKLEELNEPSPRVPGVRALLPLPCGAGLLMGGTDCKVRMWDRLRPERSYCVCGPVTKTSAAPDSYKYDSRVVQGVQVVQEMFVRHQGSKATPSSKRLFAAAATDTVGCHRDSILSLAAAQTTQHLLISSSRDGSIKVWR
ncbi:hypothetical protein GOP47_0002147 [Adiantum capillus-veneris]|uniref:non-specific serine/threonine protein kinase n=1 Tax=Adiantum capillus-veneris TaxID=13818 RepID=A0A9D4V8M6_ADICA|nr:hypothetical protein GOP47_0001287 [Adiantum capillus-veneris]KAI5082404.1 hypothetical protein GOP47_0002147 [Adiantum capillus-veneris]